MSGKGNCYDNAVCESFFHTLKVEHVYRLSFESIEHAKQQIFWFIEGSQPKAETFRLGLKKSGKIRASGSSKSRLIFCPSFRGQIMK